MLCLRWSLVLHFLFIKLVATCKVGSYGISGSRLGPVLCSYVKVGMIGCAAPLQQPSGWEAAVWDATYLAL